MTPSRGKELATELLEDPTKATPLLRLLHIFNTSRGDPVADAERRDVMLHVWTHVENCEEAMAAFLSEDQTNPVQRAA